MQRILGKYRDLPVQVKASLWFLLCSILQKGISVITTPIFTRLLTAEEYGEFGAFNSWYLIILVIVGMNLASGVYTTAMVKFSDDRKILASSYQGITLVLCVGWFVVYLVFSGFWNRLFGLTTIQMIAMFIMIWTSAAFGLWSVEQRVTYNYKSLVGITALVSIASPVIGILLVINSEDKVTARILGLAAVELVGYTGFAVHQMVRGKRLFSKEYWSYAIKFNLPLIPHALSQTVLSSADRIMIKDMVGATQAGYYNLAYGVSSIMLIFNTSLSQTLAPWTYQKLKDDKVEDLNRVAVFTIALIGFLNLLLIAFAPEIISIFAPQEYSEAAYVIPPVAMSVFFMYLYDWFARFEYYYEKTIYILIASMSGAVLNIILNYIFLNKFGYIAAGYTTFACYGVYCFMHYYFMRRICKKYLQGRRVYSVIQLVSVSIVFMACGFILLTTYQNMVIRYACCLIVLLIVFFNRKMILSRISEILNIRKKKA